MGSWSGLPLHKQFEAPLWSETLPEASGGSISVNLTTHNQMNLGVGDVFRLLGDGVHDVAMTAAEHAVADAPELERLDVPFLALSADEARAMVDAARPMVADIFRTRVNGHVLAIAPSPPQVVFSIAYDHAVERTQAAVARRGSGAKFPFLGTTRSIWMALTLRTGRPARPGTSQSGWPPAAWKCVDSRHRLGRGALAGTFDTRRGARATNHAVAAGQLQAQGRLRRRPHDPAAAHHNPGPVAIAGKPPVRKRDGRPR